MTVAIFTEARVRFREVKNTSETSKIKVQTENLMRKKNFLCLCGFTDVKNVFQVKIALIIRKTFKICFNSVSQCDDDLLIETSIKITFEIFDDF